MAVTGSNRRRLVWITAGVVVVAAAALFWIAGGGRGYGLPEGEPMPRLGLRDYRGRAFDAGTLRGRVVAILFWKGSVGASVAELKGLEELEAGYGDRGLEGATRTVPPDQLSTVATIGLGSQLNQPPWVPEGKASGGSSGTGWLPTVARSWSTSKKAGKDWSRR